jgi:hypothetical protein
MAGRPQDAAKRRAFVSGVMPQTQRTGSVTLSAPVGGINTAVPAGAMPTTDCLKLENMIAYQYGLRVRAGYTDWFTGIQSINDFTGVHEFDTIRTLLPFNGAAEDGSNDRLFACTREGIYDVSHRTNDITTFVDPSSTACVFQFTNTTYYAGLGVSTAFSNSAGEHFLAYCDGANGYLLYRESTDTWEKILQSPNVAWLPGTVYTAGTKIVNGGLAYNCTVGGTSQTKWSASTAYVVGDKRVNGLGLYECTSAGTSEVAGGPTGIGVGEVDGTVTWKYVSLAGPIGVGNTVADGTVTWDYYPTIAGVNPTTFRYVMQWKNRLWFVPGNSQDAYYLEVGTFAGQAHKMIFSPRFRYGGDLVGLWSWTLDGGQGVDDLLVAISRGGDVAVYAGTNPAYAETFGLKGVWWVGPVPPGRTIASDFGGDLFILSRVGCLPLSRLVAGGLIRDPNIYETAKVANLFNQLMSDRGMREGWAMTQHPDDNLIVINVPGAAGHPSEQLVMSLATKGWARHSGVPIQCMTTWHGKLFFGTTDGRVCVSEGHVDSGLVATKHVGEGTSWDYTDNYAQHIDFSLLSAFQNLGNANKKRVHMARPYFITDGTPPAYALQARYDYDLSAGTITPPAVGIAANSWDNGLWDVALWDEAAGSAGAQWGTTGMGTVVAITLRGTSIALTTLVSIDVMIDQGWLL